MHMHRRTCFIAGASGWESVEKMSAMHSLDRLFPAVGKREQVYKVLQQRVTQHAHLLSTYLIILPGLNCTC